MNQQHKIIPTHHIEEKKTLTEKHIITESGEKNIQIPANTDAHLFFFIYDATVKLTIDLIGEWSNVACSIIVISAARIVSGVDFSVTLKASHTKADVYALSLLGDNAKAQVNGGIVIDPWLIQVEGYLSEENMLLWENITIKTLPMLDVRSNDVKASHGATIDRLDPQKLFYLSAKWLSASQAQRLMVQSYMQKALDHANCIDEKLIDEMFVKVGIV